MLFKQIVIGMLGLGLVLIGLQGCEAPAQNASSLQVTAQPTVVVPADPVAPDCSAHPALGVWRNNANASDVIEFRSDCTGYAVWCNLNFTYGTIAAFAIPVVESGRNLAGPAGCAPAAGPYNATRTFAGYLSPAMNGGSMRLQVNYNGSMNYTKQ